MSAAGATVRRGARVLAVEGGATRRVSYGVDERVEAATARLVVGADGRSSRVRKALGRQPETRPSGRLLAGVRLVNVGGDSAMGYFILNDKVDGVTPLFPQGDGFARAYVFAQGDAAASYAGPGGYQRFIATAIKMGIPEDVIGEAEQAGPLAAFVADDSWIEHSAGDGFVLIGDAAGISDPTWGMGLALAFRDARVLAEALAGNDEWAVAADAYATERRRYFETVQTAESWMSELTLTRGAAARRRRLRAMRLWAKNPSRALDLPGLGPAVDISETARERFFGEDISERTGAEEPAKKEDRIVTKTSEFDARAVGREFLVALRNRDFEALERLIHPRARTRALIHAGYTEFVGAPDLIAEYRGWFEQALKFEPRDSDVSLVGDRLHISYGFTVQRPNAEGLEEVDQQIYAQVRRGRILGLDLFCSGFQPSHASEISATYVPHRYRERHGSTTTEPAVSDDAGAAAQPAQS